MADLKTWENAVRGVGLNVDGYEGKQCVDVDLSWGQALFPGIPWQTVFPPTPDAKDLLNTYNPHYWDRVFNDHNNPNQIPPPGAVVVYGPTPQYGYTNKYDNPYGHTGVCESANPQGVYLIQQDGSDPNTVTSVKFRPWDLSPCLGWLIPKSQTPPKPVPVSSPVAAPPSAPLPIVNTETYYVQHELQGYETAGQAAGRVNPRVTVPQGSYTIFNRFNGMVNVTRAPGKPGAWINPNDNANNPAVAEQMTIPVAPPIPDPVPVVNKLDLRPEYLANFRPFKDHQGNEYPSGIKHETVNKVPPLTLHDFTSNTDLPLAPGDIGSIKGVTEVDGKEYGVPTKYYLQKKPVGILYENLQALGSPSYNDDIDILGRPIDPVDKIIMNKARNNTSAGDKFLESIAKFEATAGKLGLTKVFDVFKPKKVKK